MHSFGNRFPWMPIQGASPSDPVRGPVRRPAAVRTQEKKTAGAVRDAKPSARSGRDAARKQKNARWENMERKRASFGGLRNDGAWARNVGGPFGAFRLIEHFGVRQKVRAICRQPLQALGVQVFKANHSIARIDDPFHNMSVRAVLSGLVSLIGASVFQGDQARCPRHAQPLHQSPLLHIHAPYSANR